MMKPFVNIKTAFGSPDERKVDALINVYNDQQQLLKLVQSVTSEHLTIEDIANKRVFLKPNWVLHDRKESDKWCMRTHENLILALLQHILSMKPFSVLIGDAPIQGCNWDKMVQTEFYSRVKLLSERFAIPVAIKDFRRVTFNPEKNNLVTERNPLSAYTIFDLGTLSNLEEISRADKSLFRVTNYNPDRLAISHRPGVHKYCITNELFDADVVISMPKVKTHQKTGITAALKNIVGLNGDKDFLPHHRLGGTGFGGDCYPGANYLRYWAELSLDFANRRQGKLSYWLGVKLSAVLWKLSLPKKEHHLAAAWHGNDTTWRMVLDLNKIAIFGKKDGTISDSPQRVLFSFCDGVIGGQGDGPLRPEPLPLGIVSFTNHSGFNDLAMATLMGFDVDKIPMLKKISEINRHLIPELYFNNNQISFDELKTYCVKTLPPPGWEKYLQEI